MMCSCRSTPRCESALCRAAGGCSRSPKVLSRRSRDGVVLLANAREGLGRARSGLPIAAEWAAAAICWLEERAARMVLALVHAHVQIAVAVLQ